MNKKQRRDNACAPCIFAAAVLLIACVGFSIASVVKNESVIDLMPLIRSYIRYQHEGAIHKAQVLLPSSTR